MIDAEMVEIARDVDIGIAATSLGANLKRVSSTGAPARARSAAVPIGSPSTSNGKYGIAEAAPQAAPTPFRSSSICTIAVFARRSIFLPTADR